MKENIVGEGTKQTNRLGDKLFDCQVSPFHANVVFPTVVTKHIVNY